MSNHNKEAEPVLDTKKIDAWYTMILQKAFKSADKAILQAHVDAKGVRMRIISIQRSNGYDNYITITCKKNKILGQLPAQLFYKK